jgi:hypothetical protein
MSLLKAKKLGLLAASVGLLAMVAAQGCGDSSDGQASPTAGAPAGGKSGAGTGGKGSAGSAGKNSSGGKGGDTSEGGSGNETSMGGDSNPGEGGMGGEGPGPNCDGPDGCYSCTPTTNTQFLNHCVEGGCPATFDNTTLTKLNLVGTL